ncbi:MAG TPA: FecR family protein [Woeseiaceae bacterium]
MIDDEYAGRRPAGPEEHDSIAWLMRLAGPRPAVPADVRARVHAAVRSEWRGVRARRRVVRWSAAAALAASIVLAVALDGHLLLTDDGPVARIAVASASANGLAVGDAVHAGDSITTGASGMALDFDDGLSLRLAARTTATIDAADEVSLVNGRLYVDTGSSIARAERAIIVHTEAGSATDHGTQFAVGYAGGAMTVAVREGQVDVSARQASYTTKAGEKLVLAPGEPPAYQAVAPHDDSWAWAAALAPEFDSNNRPVSDFLAWAARETGRKVVFRSDAARVAAMTIRLRAPLSGFTPAEAIEAVAPTVPSLHLEVETERLVVDLSE